MGTKFDGDMTPVKSSSVEAVGYDPGRRALAVRFKGGAVHVYHDVKPEQHQQLLGAESVGKHFAKHIRNGFKSTKL
jgi:hypothetical protein